FIRFAVLPDESIQAVEHAFRPVFEIGGHFRRQRRRLSLRQLVRNPLGEAMELGSMWHEAIRRLLPLQSGVDSTRLRTERPNAPRREHYIGPSPEVTVRWPFDPGCHPVDDG